MCSKVGMFTVGHRGRSLIAMPSFRWNNTTKEGRNNGYWLFDYGVIVQPVLISTVYSYRQKVSGNTRTVLYS